MHKPMAQRHANSGANLPDLKLQKCVAAFTEIVGCDDALQHASKRDLAVVEGLLLVVLDSVSAELRRRDQQQQP